MINDRKTNRLRPSNSLLVFLRKGVFIIAELRGGSTIGGRPILGKEARDNYIGMIVGNKLKESTLYQSGTNIRISGNIMVDGTTDPTISLALGDSDTGFNWLSDGSFDVFANNKSIINFNNTTVTIKEGVTLSNNALSGVTTIIGQYGTIAQSSSDEWLRINGDGSHTAGIYFGSSIVRTDGQFQVGNTGSAFLVDSSGNVTAKAMKIVAQDSTNEGGELTLVGAGTFTNLGHIDRYQDSIRLWIDSGSLFVIPKTGNVTWDGGTVWTSKNDGVGSGLDADLLNGYQLASTVSADGNALLQKIPFIKSDGVMEVAKFIDFHDQGASTQTDYDVRFTVTGNGSSGGGNLTVSGKVATNGMFTASGGFTVEVRTTDPSTPVTGQMWLRSDL